MFMRTREELLENLHRMGAAACAYTADPERWLETRCDCKYGGDKLGSIQESGNGCPELRSVYAIIEAMSEVQYMEWVEKAGGVVLLHHFDGVSEGAKWTDVEIKSRPPQRRTRARRS